MEEITSPVSLSRLFFCFWSCVTFVIDNLVLKLCEPRFKLRTSWKIRIGDVLRERRDFELYTTFFED